MVLLVLALIWAAVLLPPFVRARLEGHPTDSVGRFRRHLRILESTSPAAFSLAYDPVMVSARNGAPAPTLPATWAVEAARLRRQRRRRQVARILLGLMGTTLVLGLIPALRPILILHVIADIAFVSYIALLVKARNEARQRRVVASATAPVEPDIAADVVEQQAL